MEIKTQDNMDTRMQNRATLALELHRIKKKQETLIALAGKQEATLEQLRLANKELETQNKKLQSRIVKLEQSEAKLKEQIEGLRKEKFNGHPSE